MSIEEEIQGSVDKAFLECSPGIAKYFEENKSSFVEPYVSRLNRSSVEGDQRDFYVVFEEDPHDVSGLKIVYDPIEKRFGLAMGSAFIGYHGTSFLDAVKAL